QEKRAFAGLGDGRLVAVLAALALLDADHLGALLGQQRGAVGAGDVAAEIQHPDTFEYARHVVLSEALRARAMAQPFGVAIVAAPTRFGKLLVMSVETMRWPPVRMEARIRMPTACQKVISLRPNTAGTVRFQIQRNTKTKTTNETSTMPTATA